jgi:hypothetical protein
MEVKFLEIDSVVWMVLPLLILVVVAALKATLGSRIKLSGKTSKIVGIVVAATIICLYVAWKLLNGGF